MCRFLRLDTTEIPVNSISETRSLIEMLSGRGSVQVAGDIGTRHKVRMQEIDDPGPVAETIRELAPERNSWSNHPTSGWAFQASKD